MNLPDNPSDRLIDSLLREQMKGRADEALLREIAAGLNVAKQMTAQRNAARKKIYWAAAAIVTFFCLIGLSWSASHMAREKARKVEAARQVEMARHASARESERKLLEAKFRTGKPALPLAGDGSGKPQPSIGEDPDGSKQALPGEPDAEGLNLRFLAMEKGSISGGIFVHDPDGREGAQGRQLEPMTYLAGDAGRMNFKGSKIVLTRSADPASLSDAPSIVASSYVGQTKGRGIMLLLPGTGRAGDPPAQLLFVDDRLAGFPAGSTLVVNASSKDLRLKLEDETHDCRAGDQMLIGKLPVGGNRMTKMSGYFQRGDGWRIFVSSMWPELGPNMRALQVCFDGRSPEVQLMGIREDLGATLASDEKPSGETDAKEADDYAQPEVVVNGEIQMAAKDPEEELARLVFVRSAATKWYVQFGIESEGRWSPRFTGMTPLGKRLQNRVSAVEMLAVGDVFFREGPMAGRFKFTGMIEREVVAKRTGLRQTVKIAQYHDLRGPFAGKTYESQSGLPEADLEGVAYQDPTAVFDFFPGEGEKSSFEVQLGERFSLPPGAPQPRYLLKSVDAGSVTLEYQDQAGQTKRSILTLK